MRAVIADNARRVAMGQVEKKARVIPRSDFDNNTVLGSAGTLILTVDADNSRILEIRTPCRQ